jgi:uncharacterized iron-regulated protein
MQTGLEPMPGTKTYSAIVAAAVLIGCSSVPPKTFVKDTDVAVEPGTILSAASGKPISFDQLITELKGVRVVYIGESHTDSTHHRTQLDIIQALFGAADEISIGMEMFDFTYQPVLDRWSSGELEEAAFLEKVHWYANWRYPFSLYRDILEFVRDNRIPLVGLNIPFHIPPKVRIGGLANLGDADARHLPSEIDTSDSAHRAYVEPVFKQHAFHSSANFDYFYEAQCLWEETMAESIASSMPSGIMVVLAGNGHIVYKFGIPQRAFRRTSLPYRTVYLSSAGKDIELVYGDYIWVTPAPENAGRMGH